MLAIHATPRFSKCSATGLLAIISSKSKFQPSSSSSPKLSVSIHIKFTSLALLVTKNMAFLKTPNRLKSGNVSLPKPVYRRKLLKLALVKTAPSVVLRKTSIFSSMMITKTGGVVVVVLKLPQLVIHVVQIPKSSMILVKTSKMLRNTVNLIRPRMARASWKLVTKFSCNTSVIKMVPSRN